MGFIDDGQLPLIPDGWQWHSCSAHRCSGEEPRSQKVGLGRGLALAEGRRELTANQGLSIHQCAGDGEVRWHGRAGEIGRSEDGTRRKVACCDKDADSLLGRWSQLLYDDAGGHTQ